MIGLSAETQEVQTDAQSGEDKEETIQNETKEDRGENRILSVFLWLFLSFLPTVILLFARIAHMQSVSMGAMAQTAAAGLVFLFVILFCESKHIWKYNNEQHKLRFALIFLGCICLMLFCCMIPPLLWLYLPIGVSLMLFSHRPQAISGLLLLLTAQYYLCGMTAEVFVTMTLIGLSGILLFGFLDEEFLFGMPLFAAMLLQTLLLFSMEYSVRGEFIFRTFVFTGTNLLVSFLLLTGLLKYLSFRVLHKSTDRFSEINDPEFELLVQLKEKNLRAYYHAVHTAHFCEKLAEKIGADPQLCKAGGYYHKIGRMRGQSNLVNALKIAEEYSFPPSLISLLREYGSKNTTLRSKEAAIVLISDAMVSSVMFLFEKNKDARLNYEQLVSVVFAKQLESGYLDECDLTMSELSTIKRCFMEEKLYYDFLR